MADESSTAGLPNWPAAAREQPAPRSPSPETSLDGWLVPVAILDPVAGFGLLLFGGGRAGPLAFGPEVIFVPALLLIAAAVGGKLGDEFTSWRRVSAFAAWVVLVALAQLWLWFEAVALA